MEKHDTTAAAVPIGSSINKNANKIKKKPDAIAVPTGSSGNKLLENPVDAIFLPTCSCGNVSGGNEVKDKPDAIAVAVIPLQMKILLKSPIPLLLFGLYSSKKR